ncbi:transcriptional regulator, TetR family [Streptomyces sp. DconLS]|nr:transcriptional regulator, TetR family [Streptomyces sp. DconLS]
MAAARESLLDAAGAALARRPWSAVRMVEVAAAAGVSRQTLYNEFGGKDGLARALVRRAADGYLAGVERALAGGGGDWERLTAVAEWTAAATQQDALVRALLTGCWSERLPAPPRGPPRYRRSAARNRRSPRRPNSYGSSATAPSPRCPAPARPRRHRRTGPLLRAGRPPRPVLRHGATGGGRYRRPDSDRRTPHGALTDPNRRQYGELRRYRTPWGRGRSLRSWAASDRSAGAERAHNARSRRRPAGTSARRAEDFIQRGRRGDIARVAPVPPM